MHPHRLDPPPPVSSLSHLLLQGFLGDTCGIGGSCLPKSSLAHFGIHAVVAVHSGVWVGGWPALPTKSLQQDPPAVVHSLARCSGEMNLELRHPHPGILSILRDPYGAPFLS